MSSAPPASAALQRNVLPADPSPKNYNVTITPDLTAFTFAGRIVIDLVAAAPVTAVTFNAAELTFLSGSLSTAAAGKLQSFNAEEFVIDTRNDRATLQLAAAVGPGEFQLEIAYTGIMNDKLNGFYRSKYTVKGEPAFMGITQFEACDCRRALPCWDEPARKATFDVTLVVEEGMLALSNMDEKSRRVENGKAHVSFNRTPIMSTYLLAWCVGYLEVIEQTIQKTNGGTTLVRVFAPEGKIKQGEFALEVACKTLPLYESFFGSDYFLSKCDLLAIPDFAAGAMENWGLITYRETALLCDATSSAKHREYVALVVAHELAHQWFGNLVTMDWWKELWLNESFATWVEYWAVDTLYPAWQVFTQFVNDETGRAYDLDAMLSSHPVEVDLVNAEEIDEIFDAISYSKGGSILRMVVEFIGLDAFRRGLAKYLDHFKFRNATSKDLWDFLGAAAGVDLTGLLNSWILKQGYPVLRANVAADGQTVHLTQNRFLAKGPASAEQDTTVWEIPTKIRSAGAPATASLQVFKDRSGSLPVASGAPTNWVKVNADQAAFCRVLYDDANLARLCDAVQAPNGGGLTTLDRLGLMLDYHAMSVAGLASAASALRILAALRTEQDATVWYAALAFEREVKGLLSNEADAVKERFRTFAMTLYSDVKARLGLLPQATDDHRSANLRGLILARLVSHRDAATIDALAGMFERDETIPADIRGAAYFAAIRKLGEPAWTKLCALHESTTDSMERSRCLRALGLTEDTELLQKTVEYLLSPKVRTQDAAGGLMSVAGNDKGGVLFADLLATRFPELHAKFPIMILSRIVKVGIESLDDALADRMEAVLNGIADEKQKASVERSFQQGIEGLRVHASWRARDLEGIRAFVLSL